MVRLSASPKISGSSLVEVTVAMVILVAIISVSMMILVRLGASGPTGSKFRHAAVARADAREMKKRKYYMDGKQQMGETMLCRKVTAYGKDLLLLEIAVQDLDGDTLTLYREIVYEPE